MTKKKASAFAETLFLVTPRIFLRNPLEEDLISLYDKLVELGMEYRDGEVYLIDLEELN